MIVLTIRFLNYRYLFYSQELLSSKLQTYLVLFFIIPNVVTLHFVTVTLIP